MNDFDEEMAAADAAIYQALGDEAIYIHRTPAPQDQNGYAPGQLIEDQIPVQVLIDVSEETYERDHVEHRRQVMVATMPNPGVKVFGKNSIQVLVGKHAGTYSVVKTVFEDADEIAVIIK